MSNNKYKIIAGTGSSTSSGTDSVCGGGGVANVISTASSNVCTSTRWLTEEVFQLIDFVQRNEAIYNSRHKYYFCRPYVENFWREIDLKLEKNPGASLAKWTNLRISFRREYTNYLEEKVSPCWTYFDRMFFLHPYLRKKYQQNRSLDSCMQDALAQISSIQTCFTRKCLENNSNNNCTIDNTVVHKTSKTSSSAPPGQLDNYLDYLEESVPETNPCELDDIVHSANIYPIIKEIKSECEDNVDEYEQENQSIVDEDCNDDGSSELNDMAINNGQHVQYSYNLQSKAEHFENLTKRIRLDDDVSSTSTSQPPLISSSIASSYTNVENNDSVLGKSSILHKQYRTKNRPLVKSICQNSITSNTKPNNIVESTSHPLNSTNVKQSSNYMLDTNQNINCRGVEFPAEIVQSVMSTVSNASTSTTAAKTSQATTGDLCDCKSDPDAMFLMSLLPDMHKLNGRDRGKIKIAFQNIIQDFLYPD